ncbi:bifunctional DNA-formamidopyrimidine glycosylase/DNA-(apurinic or apyrimidinic site) lyase [Bhargavaea ginsengi]|uniref:bifunctional DNA-formamidopyrimidine glycosylase/DNA-(apurinic or apyrimidinic site) lyase n=1 Tax=Bhargavaea ginsengi TaxID=426757 RepID=UPI0020419E92|nr:bifunctional DNA-formamidopyrimidine glycosylase/DNA-(apurinic or apyrimidinic site) lyase [Bhargavaea ginsengi]MCM3086411.1 bifunctional DNA-formamidopyrimidine glycosylase/DNA-(apurinic or apyrimidinic site) lyase [Bhargavaea ginsengi]
MPELPEVEGVVRSLAPAATGRTIRDIKVSDTIIRSKSEAKEAILKNSSPEEFAGQLRGMTITNVTRRSKYIYFHLEKDGEPHLLVSHLGMSGAWFAVRETGEVAEDKFRRHIHVIFAMEDGGLLVYADIRRFGELRLIREEADHPPLLTMAPEPFDETAAGHFLSMCKTPKYAGKPIKETIMDGKVISGCGNIYATEALFRTGIHPGRKTGRISMLRLESLFHEIQKVLAEAIEAGGSSISDYRNINGEAGNMQERLRMYGRKNCPGCGAETKRMTIGGRTSVYCPKCQH